MPFLVSAQARPGADRAGDVDTVRFFSPRRLGVVLAAASLIGLLAAFVLAVEKFWLLSNPFYQPSCSISARFSCTSVMTSPQAELFGFPNPLLGIAGFAVVLTTAAALIAGARLSWWYWIGLQVGACLGVVFVHWLMWQSFTQIGALCPYCMVVWAVMIVIFIYVTAETVSRLVERLGHSAPSRMLLGYHSTITAGWLLLIAAIVVITSLPD